MIIASYNTLPILDILFRMDTKGPLSIFHCRGCMQYWFAQDYLMFTLTSCFMASLAMYTVHVQKLDITYSVQVCTCVIYCKCSQEDLMSTSVCISRTVSAPIWYLSALTHCPFYIFSFGLIPRDPRLFSIAWAACNIDLHKTILCLC